MSDGTKILWRSIPFWRCRPCWAPKTRSFPPLCVCHFCRHFRSAESYLTTVALSEESTSSFGGSCCEDDGENSILFQVGIDCLQILDTRRRELVQGVRCNFNEVLQLCDINEIAVASKPLTPLEFHIRTQRQSMYYNSDEREALVEVCTNQSIQFGAEVDNHYSSCVPL